MTAATLVKKDDFATNVEVEPSVGTAVASTAVAGTAIASAAAALAGDEAVRKRPKFKVKLPPGRELFDAAWPPLLGVFAVLGLWTALAPMVQTSLGALPGPDDVWGAFKGLMIEYSAARADAAAAVASGQLYSGPPTFVDQIFTSLKTVAMGVTLSSLVAVPLGLVAGMSKLFNSAINPMVQLMRPIIPLSWMQIVTMVFSASITGDDPTLPKSFVISAIVVMMLVLASTRRTR